MNLVESLLHALKDHGARQIFGIPGDFALPYFRIIEQSKILQLYTLSHEPAVGFAADASARVNMGLGVAAVTYGAGATTGLIISGWAWELGGAPFAFSAAALAAGAGVLFALRLKRAGL